MSDIPNPKIDAFIFEAIQPVFREELIHDLGTSAAGGAFMDTSYRRPSFYEKEKNRGTKLVDMDANGDIEVANGDEGRIATFGLGGCSAVAISAELPDGTRKGYVQHYSPLNRQLSASTLANTTAQLSAEGATNVRAVVMTPGEYVQDPEAKWVMKPKDDLLTGLLTTTALSRLGADTDVEVYPYSEMMSVDQYGKGTLMVEFRDDGTTQILAESMPVRSEN